MNNIYFMCENCGIETNGITFVNGMKFCAKCYHQIFGKDNQQTEITQLKQQLTEKQNTIDEINKEFVQAVHDWKTLCAEKDKEIERLKQELEETNAGYDFTYEQSTETIKELKQNQTQLAIQELEKVKEYIQKHKYKTLKEDRYVVYYKSLKDQIFNQIKALKGNNDEPRQSN